MESMGGFFVSTKECQSSFCRTRDNLDLDFILVPNLTWLHPTSKAYVAGNKIQTAEMDITFA